MYNKPEYHPCQIYHKNSLLVIKKKKSFLKTLIESIVFNTNIIKNIELNVEDYRTLLFNPEFYTRHKL